jgi:23S rRNA-/tRNA-specific pseudouridylate synthase
MGIPRWLVDTEVTRPLGVPDDAIVRVLRVPPEGAGVRLDVFLSGALRNTSRTRAKLIAEHSAFSPAGRRRKASERVRAEDHIVLWRRPVDDVDPELELPVLFEDEHLLVLDKPANLTVHPTARHHHATVTKILQQRYPGQRLQLIHRLDRETSGVLLVAKTPASERAFKMKFEGIVPVSRPPRVTRAERRRPRLVPGSDSAPVESPRQRLVDKEYYAICWGGGGRRPDRFAARGRSIEPVAREDARGGARPRARCSHGCRGARPLPRLFARALLPLHGAPAPDPRPPLGARLAGGRRQALRAG